MALTAREKELFDAACAALPSWFSSDAAQNEFTAAAAKIMAPALDIVDFWVTQNYIKQAVGATTGQPDWLAALAKDRGTYRQSDGQYPPALETDAALRDRIRRFNTATNEAVTPGAILTALQGILTALGQGSLTMAIVELPRDQAYFSTLTQDFGTGGTFSGPVSGVMEFSPTVEFAYPPFIYGAEDGRVRSNVITIGGAAHSGNNGVFTVTGLDGNKVKYANGSGTAEADPTVVWTTTRMNAAGASMEGHALCYFDRGDRIALSRFATILIIVPYIADASLRGMVQRSLAEVLRLKKGAGVISIVETRANP